MKYGIKLHKYKNSRNLNYKNFVRTIDYWTDQVESAGKSEISKELPNVPEN